MYVYMYIYTARDTAPAHCTHIQAKHQAIENEIITPGGEDSWEGLSCRSFSAKEPLIIGLFCGK